MEGKADAVQGVRGRRRVPDLPRHEGPGRDRRARSRRSRPVFGGINLEDISAPRCFEIERRLRESLDIPVFHDDQHGTAIVVLAALLNALRVVGKRIEDVRVVTTGCGAAGMAVTRTLSARRRDRDRRLRRGRRALSRPARPERREARVRRDDEPGQPARNGGRAARRCRRLHRRLRPRRRHGGRHPAHGRPRDRLRDGEPDARGRPRGDRRPRRGHRHRPLRLSEPDQQRPRVPGRLPGRTRRPRTDDQR